MFDSIKKGLAKFTGRVAEEATLAKDAKEAKDAKTTAPAAQAQPPAARSSAAASKKASAEEDWEDELASIEAEVEKERLKSAPAPAAPAPAPKPVAPAPAKAPAPAPAPMPAPRPAEARPAVVEVPKSTPKPATTFETVAKPAAPAAPRPPPAATPPAAPRPSPAAAVAEKGRSIEVGKIDDLLWDLELSLLESDVALPVVEQIKELLKAKLPSIRVASVDEVPAAVEKALRESLLETLSVKPIDFDSWVLEKTLEKKPVVIMFVGVNGTGKTTSIGRIAYRLKENGYTSVMAAGDTFRAGAIQQLEKHAEKVGVSFIKTTPGGDPAAVAFDAIEHAKGRMKDVVLLDTAGRMQTNTNLMDEMKKIKRVAKPDMIVFVGDSLAGNDAVEQAVQFDKAVGIDAVILTKVDTDAKGGAALSIAKAVGKPILFLGVGQEYADIVPYDPQWMVDRIFESS